MSNPKVVILRSVESPDLKEQLWQIYKQSFASSEVICGQEQRCYTEEKFKAALEDPEYVKYILIIEEENRIIGYMLSTNNLQKASITYMNPGTYQACFPEFADGKINYCTSLAIHKDYSSGANYMELMGSFLVHIFYELQGQLSFDFSHKTMETLPKSLSTTWKRYHRKKGLVMKFDLEYQKVDAQEFGAMIPKK